MKIEVSNYVYDRLDKEKEYYKKSQKLELSDSELIQMIFDRLDSYME